jgi:hypothetical protein
LLEHEDRDIRETQLAREEQTDGTGTGNYDVIDH